MNDLPLNVNFKTRNSDEKILNIIIVILTVFFMLTILFNTIYTRIYVVGSSMRNTLIGSASPDVAGGDYVYICEYKEPKPGDIVMIKAGNRNLIKRVLAFGGDRVKLVNGDLYVNDKFVEEPYVSPENKTNLSRNNFDEITVDEGCIFFMGDNRDNSEDSRGSYGCMPKESIVGVVVGWSLYNKEFITEWNTFFEFTLPEGN